MPIPDLSGLTDAELAELQGKAMKERGKRQQDNELAEAATNLINQARNIGYSKTVVQTFLKKVIDDVYA